MDQTLAWAMGEEWSKTFRRLFDDGDVADALEMESKTILEDLVPDPESRENGYAIGTDEQADAPVLAIVASDALYRLYIRNSDPPCVEVIRSVFEDGSARMRQQPPNAGIYRRETWSFTFPEPQPSLSVEARIPPATDPPREHRFVRELARKLGWPIP